MNGEIRMPLDDFLSRALDLASVQGASYCDVRLVETNQERFVVRSGAVETLSNDESQGIGVRVLVSGCWGFASTNIVAPDEIDRITNVAVEIAKASAQSSTGQVSLGPPVTSQGVYTTPIRVNPFTISLEDKLGLLLEADARMGSVKGISARTGNLIFIKEHKSFANSEGAHVEQTIYEAGGGIMATARGNGEIQRRSYPQSMRQQGCAGWEFVDSMDLAGNAERIASEAVALLSAKHCPSGVTTLIVGASQLGLQIHESCGHAIELDRVLGSEAAYAGTSFLTTDKLNNFQYGSEHINITADSVRLPGLGSYGWDDEGVPAQSTPVVQNGQFTGYLTSRETASGLNLIPNGSMRAASWNRIPLIRMNNVSLEPGNWNLDDLIADTDDGILMEMNRSWSIDDRRFNFQFGTEIGYEIKKGKLGKALRNCTYTGITPEFWNSCDAVCNEELWTMWGIPNCGKGQPGQIGHTGHGAAPARFRNIQVGVMK
ncbi:MAG: TldD/PmbA family protein [Chloroflexota bacterium]|nr:TldD/PmbA family protein [Dehalococcoidia bacterium]MEE3013641.1 TldD/PmbA family protein [Chloroflexota bacterium]